MRTDAIKLSQKEQALLRRQAIRMKERGDAPAQIAEVLAVHPKTVARWWTAYRRHGAATLRPGQRGRRVGANRVLTPDQEQAVCRLLRDKTPDQLKLPFALWTRQPSATCWPTGMGYDCRSGRWEPTSNAGGSPPRSPAPGRTSRARPAAHMKPRSKQDAPPARLIEVFSFLAVDNR